MTPELAQEILERIGSAVIAADRTGRIVLWNEESQRLFGVPAESMRKRYLPEVGPALLGEFGAHMAAEFAATNPSAGRRTAHLFHHPDGRLLWIDLQTKWFSGGPGDSPVFIALAQDVSAEKAREQSYLRDELRLQTILNSVTDAIISVDDQFRIVLINPAAEAMFRCARGEVLGRPMSKFCCLAEVLTHIQQGRTAHGHAPGREVCTVQGRRADGRTFSIEAAFSSVTVNERQFHTAVMRDISRQEQMEKALIQSQKNQAVGTLASGIAHDFNNIFAAILSHLDLVALAPEFPPSLKEYVNHAQTAARRGADVVGKLQGFSNGSELKLEPLDVGGLMERVNTIMCHSLGRRVRMHGLRLTPGIAWVQADANQMMQVLVNLCLNARDAMPDGGELFMHLDRVQLTEAAAGPQHKPGDYVKITVADTGKGMPPEVLQRLFEPYFSTKKVGAGVGLGLSIAHNIVTEHGGWFDVESSCGLGSRFHIYLPSLKDYVAVQSQSPALPATESAATPVAKESVLVVDDESAIRLTVRTVLAYRGHRVVEAAHGLEALEKIRQAQLPFDLILLDVHMPHMTGWELLEEIRQSDQAVPVIIMSGGSSDGEFEEAARLGVAEFLVKPFNRAALLESMARALATERRMQIG